MCGCVCILGCVYFITNKIIVNNNNIHHKHVFFAYCFVPFALGRIVTSVGSGDVGTHAVRRDGHTCPGAGQSLGLHLPLYRF